MLKRANKFVYKHCRQYEYKKPHKNHSISLISHSLNHSQIIATFQCQLPCWSQVSFDIYVFVRFSTFDIEREKKQLTCTDVLVLKGLGVL